MYAHRVSSNLVDQSFLEAATVFSKVFFNGLFDASLDRKSEDDMVLTLYASQYIFRAVFPSIYGRITFHYH